MNGEFAKIETLRALLGEPETPGEVWIGDDAAVVYGQAGRLLLTADTAVAGVHADLGLTGLDDFGFKALAAAVSDIAAMGGTPAQALVTVTGPADTDLLHLYRGIFEAAGEFSCPVVGGDLTNGPVLVVSVAVTGWVDGAPVLRRGARPGDDIWVCGRLGASAAGLRLLREGAALAPGPLTEAVLAHARPRALIAEGRAARIGGATAMIDVSDGLGADLGHIADSSGVGFELEALPVHPAATLAEAVGGGEDYALVFCADASSSVPEAFAGLNTPMRVGRCTADRGRRLLDGQPLPATGWQHRW